MLAHPAVYCREDAQMFVLIAIGGGDTRNTWGNRKVRRIGGEDARKTYGNGRVRRIYQTIFSNNARDGLG